MPVKMDFVLELAPLLHLRFLIETSSTNLHRSMFQNETFASCHLHEWFAKAHHFLDMQPPRELGVRQNQVQQHMSPETRQAE